MAQHTRDEVAAKAKDLLVQAGIDTNSANYLGQLFADSDRGKAVQQDQKGKGAIASSCSTGIIPLF